MEREHYLVVANGFYVQTSCLDKSDVPDCIALIKDKRGAEKMYPLAYAQTVSKCINGTIVKVEIVETVVR